MYISRINIRNHPILGNIDIDLLNKETGKPFSTIVFVGENGCGKTTLLNEVFKYSDSEYIVNKETNRELISMKGGKFLSTFLRQGQLYHSSMDYIKKLISGAEALYPEESPDLALQQNKANTFYRNDGLGDLSVFNDETITKLFGVGKFNVKFVPGSDAARLIDGRTGDDSYDNYSSGQQELIFKLQTLDRLQSISDFLLLDEPETSLHPRWQKTFIEYILSEIVEDDGPQVFIATHSEKVLEVATRKDVLIVRLFRDNQNKIKAETIDQMELLLPRHTFAELDYVIFKIDSFEYCSELYDYLEWRNPDKKERAIDTLIRQSKHYDEKKHYKEWFNDFYGSVSAHNIATYCRNYFHHPKNREVPTEAELHNAIELLRNVVKDLENEQ